jgi:uncharacterized protein (TIGR00251 family)
LRVHLVPSAKRTGVDGVHGDRLKVRVAARPVEGEANAALCEFLAAAFGVARRNVELVSGRASRAKTLCVRSPSLRPDRDWG